MLTKMREELTLTLVYLLGTITLMTASIVNKEFVANVRNIKHIIFNL